MKSLTRRKIKSSNVQKDKGPPGKPRKKPVITKETFEKMMGQVHSLADAAELVKKQWTLGPSEWPVIAQVWVRKSLLWPC